MIRRRNIAVFLLCLSLVAPAASALEARDRSAPTMRATDLSLQGVLFQFWEILSSRIWTKCGASPDPFGACKSQGQPTGGGNKCGASPDPDGACKSANPDAGASADPFG